MLKQKNLPNKILCLITDTKIKNQEETLNIIENSVSSGFNMIQLREKHMSSLELLDFGRKIQKIILQWVSVLFITRSPRRFQVAVRFLG